MAKEADVAVLADTYTPTEAELADLIAWYESRSGRGNADRLLAWLRQVVRVRGGLIRAGFMSKGGDAIRDRCG